jgi:hypothetical protein
MAAVAHGWKPDRIKGPPVKVAKEFNAADTGKKIRRASGGPVRNPLETGPTSPRGALGSLGATAKVGDLGGATRPRGGLAKRPGAKGARPGSALSGRPLPRPAPTGNVRPRPGRGANPLLATSGMPAFEASDRLESLRKRVKP